MVIGCVTFSEITELKDVDVIVAKLPPNGILEYPLKSLELDEHECSRA